MIYPNQHVEKRLRKSGFKLIAGVDEAGRGSWAGPLVAAAVILDPKKRIRGIKDSKKLRSPERSLLYGQIIDACVAFGIGIVDHKIIDEFGVGKANLQAMRRAVAALPIQPDYILCDGYPCEHESIKCEGIVDGDHKVTSIAAASIIAKVFRDKVMDELDELYPAYGFKHHKGYGTSHHHHMLMQYGVSEIHRRSYEPIKYLLK